MNPIEYEIGENGRIGLPKGAPFDGKPVLIRLAAGWVEAWWCESKPKYDPVTGEHDDDGFCWVCLDDKFEAELDDAKGWAPVPSEGRITYTTSAGESIAGIALRQLRDSSRWDEIRDLNSGEFPGMGPHDYYPVGTVLKMPSDFSPKTPKKETA